MALDRSVSNVMTGARARFTVGGKTLGWAFGVTYGEEVQFEAVDVLDKFEPFEFAPTSYRVQLSAQFFRIPGQSLRAAGLFPFGGRDSDGLRRNILNQLEMEATVSDPHTNTVLARLQRVKPATRNINITPRGLVGEQVGFVAILLFDEGDPPA